MKTSTKALLLIICAQAGTSGTWMCMHLASMWLEIGHGLNPWIALPVGMFLGLIPYVIHSLWFEPDNDDRHDTSTISLRHPADYAKRERIDSGSTDFPKDVF